MTKFIRMVVEQTITIVQVIPEGKYELGTLPEKELSDIQREMDAAADEQPDPTLTIRQRVLSAEVIEA